jgi:selenocysteine lyase/cysteine desulfurase
MVEKVAEEELLQSLARRTLQHWISLYVDDVVIFLLPSTADLDLILDLLELLGEASVLKTNMHKSNVLPIQCVDEDKAVKF